MTEMQPFSPLCDVHHVPMRPVMLEEGSQQVQSLHACQRRDCTRVFDSKGYSDRAEGELDDIRASVRSCSQCGSALFLAEVEQSRKIETWECSRTDCDYSEESASPSAR